MKKILYVFFVLGLMGTGGAYARCEYNGTWIADGYTYFAGNPVGTNHPVCKQLGGKGVKTCKIICESSSWKIYEITYCEPGYGDSNRYPVDGKCPAQDVTADAAAETGATDSQKETESGASSTTTTQTKKEACTCAKVTGACAKAGIKNGQCRAISCPKTVIEKGKTYNAYMVRSKKGGAIQYYCHNDAICKQKGQVLNTWTEGGVTYTDKKCVATQSKIQVSGTIKDSEGEPLVKATVSAGTWGIVADENGTFSGVYKGAANDTVDVSFVGCEPQTFKVSELKNKTIVLDCVNEIDDAKIVGCKGDKANGIKKRTLIDDKCYPSECVTPGWKLEGTGKDAKCVQEDASGDQNEGQDYQDEQGVVSGATDGKSPDGESPDGESPDGSVLPVGGGDEEGENPDGSVLPVDGVDEEGADSDNELSNDNNEQIDDDEYVDEVLEQERAERIATAQEKYDAAKENEQALGNRMLGATAMGTMGIGGMMVASSLSEQKSDADAERDMTAYLATFKCDYGAGMNIKGGETDIELPGASELIPLYAEYVALANDLKSRKAQLGLKAGIESEKILDSATTGLYDDVSSGISSGAYASLARALQNPDGEDAKKWTEQKDKTAKNLKAGAITAGVGAVIGVAGNVISKVVANKKYRALENLEKKISGGTAATARCPSQSTGTYPDCVCNSGKEYNANLNECRTCTGGQKIDNTDGYAKCVCMGNTPLWDAERSRCVARPKTCNNGFIKGADGECECPSDQGMQVKGGKCVIIETVARSLFSATDTSTATLDAGRMFKISSAEIQSDAKDALEEFAAGLKKEGLSDCEIAITGYTDPLGDETGNQRLSEKRAKAVKDYLETLSDYTDVVISTTSTGQGENNCTCGAGTIPQGQESDKEYKVCAGQVATYPVSGNSRYAPCRRVVIEASCKKVTVGEEYE